MNIFELRVHPSADLLPMLNEEDLQEMADDIKQNGLIYPVVTGDQNGELVLIDGRNRLAACRLVDVTPEVKHFEGNINDYIHSANKLRREL